MASGNPQNGLANLHVGHVHGASTVLSSRSRTPARIFTPKPRGQSVWAYTSGLGGGMLAGDTVELNIALDPDAVCFLGSQASSKIYRNPSEIPCSHRLRATVARNATLILAPDPVQCFAGSIYLQDQTFSLAEDANLVLVDWLSAGRLARGERWFFQRYASRNEIIFGGQPLLIDALDLDATGSSFRNPLVTGRFNCLATIVLAGPRLQAAAAASLDRIGAQPITPGAALLQSASPLRLGAMLRFAGESVEDVGRAIAHHLAFVRDLLDDDPWARKW